MPSTRCGDGQAFMATASRDTPRKTMLCDGTRQLFVRFTRRPRRATWERRSVMSRAT